MTIQLEVKLLVLTLRGMCKHNNNIYCSTGHMQAQQQHLLLYGACAGTTTHLLLYRACAGTTTTSTALQGMCRQAQQQHLLLYGACAGTTTHLLLYRACAGTTTHLLLYGACAGTTTTSTALWGMCRHNNNIYCSTGHVQAQQQHLLLYGACAGTTTTSTALRGMCKHNNNIYCSTGMCRHNNNIYCSTGHVQAQQQHLLLYGACAGTTTTSTALRGMCRHNNIYWWLIILYIQYMPNTKIKFDVSVVTHGNSTPTVPPKTFERGLFYYYF